MLKKILLSALLFVGAAGAELRGDLFGGLDDIQFYVGATGGVSVFDANHRAHASRHRHFAQIGGTNGLVGGVVGAQKVFCNDIFVGIQANALYNTFDRSVHRFHAEGRRHHNHVRNNFQYGIDGRLGMNFCGTVLYVLGGVEAGDFRFDFRHVRSGGDHSTFHRSRTLWGPKVGAGITFPLTCSLNFNMEYSYTWFGNSHGRFNHDGLYWRHRHTINQNAIQFGVNYLF